MKILRLWFLALIAVAIFRTQPVIEIRYDEPYDYTPQYESSLYNVGETPFPEDEVYIPIPVMEWRSFVDQKTGR